MAGCWTNCCFNLNSVLILRETRQVALETAYFASSTLLSIRIVETDPEVNE